MRNRTRLAIPLLLALAGCQDATPPDELGLTPEEVARVADAVIGSTFEITSDGRDIDTTPPDDGTLPAITTTTRLTLTLPCVHGGQAVFDGTRVRVWDVDARTRADDFTATHSYEGCARSYDREQDGPVVITLDGDVDVLAHHAWLGWHRDGPQTLAIEGSLDWATDDGREGTCPVEILVTYDPDARTRTVEGVFCDAEVVGTTAWS